MRDEAEIIDVIRRAFRARKRPACGLLVGIGDDSAVFAPRGNSRWAISTDAFLEGVHFLPQVHRPEVAGYKALARAVSDLAAVGATPRYFLMNLALPASRSGAWLTAFTRGMARAARQFRIELIGGDTTKPPRGAGVSVNLTVIGEFVRCAPILRSGASPGDTIFLSGMAGAAQLGLELIQRGLWRNRPWRALLAKHVRPQPRLQLGAWLAQNRQATAMIDTSDGLSSDLHHLCDASRTGAIVEWNRIPAVKIPPPLAHSGFDQEPIALHGGDDYELLFTVSPKNVHRIPKTLRRLRLTAIGTITQSRKVLLEEESGKRIELRPLGWDPFCKQRQSPVTSH